MKLFCKSCKKDIRSHLFLDEEGCPYCKSPELVNKDNTDRAWINWWYFTKKTLDKTKKRW